jgi:hypothetical protein
MKRYVAALLVVLGLIGVVGVLAIEAGYAKDEDAGAKCSEATLDGTYLFAFDGVEIKGNDQLPFAIAGYDVFDGNGNVKGVASGNFGGVFSKTPYSGTYTVKADCTGTFTFADDGTQVDLFIAPDGSMYTFAEIDPGVVGSGVELRGTAKRVAQ